MQKFRETFRQTSEKFKKEAKSAHEKVVKDRLEFTQRKRNIQELISTKSKFNYMSKINDEMERIKECQDRLRYIEYEPNP